MNINNYGDDLYIYRTQGNFDVKRFDEFTIVQI